MSNARELRVLNLGAGVQNTLFSITAPRGDLPSVLIGRCVRYRPSDLEQWCEERARAGEAKAH